MMLAPAMGSKPLPTDNAFLVQLAGEVDSTLGRFAGRVEHLESGRRERFGTREELFSALARMLAHRGGRIAPEPEPEEG